MKKTPLRFLPGLQDIFFTAIFLSVLLLGQRMINLDGDLPRHLLMGRYILQNRAIPTTELFIYPYLNQPYVPHEWLTDVLFSMLYSSLGLAGIVVTLAFLLAATFTLLYNRLSSRFNLRLLTLMLVAWGASATSLNWAVRPHLISMFLLAVWLIWADELRRGEKIPVWRFPVLILVWSNLHGEFIAGILVLLAFAVGWLMEYLFDRSNTSLEIGKNLWLALLLSVLSSLINPSGIGPWTTMLGFVNDSYLMSRMVEANAPNFQNPEMRVLLGLLSLSIFFLAIKEVRLSAGQGLLLAGFSAMSLMAIRNIHLYGIVAPFVLAETLGRARDIGIVDRLESTLRKMEGEARGIAWIAIPTILIGSFVLLNSATSMSYQFVEPVFPVRAIQWLEKNPQEGDMFNDLNWGGYIAFHLWPAQLPFADSMSDTTGQVTRQYETIITLDEGWQEILDEYEMKWAIVRFESPIARGFENNGWETIYGDETAVILRRRP